MGNRIIGVKLTHDAAVCAIQDGKLLFSVEAEKVANAPRYSALSSFEQVKRILRSEQKPLRPDDVLVIDGWKHGHIAPHNLNVAPYHEFDGDWEDSPISSMSGTIDGQAFISFPHVTGHVLGAYMSAPFAGEPAHCLIWDGGIVPMLYEVKGSVVRHVANFGKLIGLIYGIMGYYAGPFKRDDLISGTVKPTKKLQLFGGRDIPGKLMSWIALGKVHPSAISAARAAYAKLREPKRTYEQSSLPEHAFVSEARSLCREVSDEDFLASLHDFLERQLVFGIKNAMPAGRNLCFAGGCALNIKWNSALRESGHFAAVWVPPFPNDSGSAIGAAATADFVLNKRRKLEWNVYAGPKLLGAGEPLPGWRMTHCDTAQLAQLLAAGEAVVHDRSRSCRECETEIKQCPEAAGTGEGCRQGSQVARRHR